MHRTERLHGVSLAAANALVSVLLYAAGDRLFAVMTFALAVVVLCSVLAPVQWNRLSTALARVRE